MMTSMGIDFPEDHIRITPRTGAEIIRASPAEVAFMIHRVLVTNHRQLYRGVRQAGYRSSIRRVARVYDIDDPDIVISDSDLRRWRRILIKIFIPAENEYERRLNNYSDEECRLLRLLVEERYPRWREMLVNHPEYSEYNQSLDSMNIVELEAMLRELKGIEEIGVRFTDAGDAEIATMG